VPGVQRERKRTVTDHHSIPDEVVTRAQDYDIAHWREDRAGERG
jgi:hypothetical protein